MSEGIHQQLADYFRLAERGLRQISSGRFSMGNPEGHADEILAILGLSAEEWDDAPTMRVRIEGKGWSKDGKEVRDNVFEGPDERPIPSGVYRLTRVEKEK